MYAKTLRDYYGRRPRFFAVVLFGSSPFSLVPGYTEIRERLRERLGWGEELEPNDDRKRHVPFPIPYIVYWLLPLQKPPSRPPIRPDHANSESQPWGTWELNF